MAALGMVLAAIIIAVVAVVARLHELRDVPRLTDETDEIVRGLQIARGELLPLTNVDAYIGPLWSYLLAAGFLAFGPSSMLPRLLTVGLGLATVVAACWLGQELALRLGRPNLAALLGFGASLLLAASSFHAIVSSRIGWSHALTPLAMTLAVSCLLRWERTRGAWPLASAGLAYGLAIHTHPTAVAFAPGLVVWALLNWRGTLATRSGWVALGLGIAANLPMLAFNLDGGMASAAAAGQVQAAYAGREAASMGGYVRNLGSLLASVPLLLAGEIGERRGAIQTIDVPLVVVVGSLAAIGLAAVTRSATPLPLLLSSSIALVLPLVNGKYEPLFNGRYLAPLLPLGFALTVLGGAFLFEQIVARTRPVGSRVRLAVAVVFLAALAVPSLLSLVDYVTVAQRDGPNNRELHRATEIVATARPSRPVLVDSTLSGARLSTGREGTGVLEYLLLLDAGQHVRRLQPEQLVVAVERGEADLVIASPRLMTRLDKDFRIEAPPGEAEARRVRRSNFTVFRVLGPAG